MAPDAHSDSLGVGMTTVVRLMHRVGARLDIMSEPGRGTTVWAHFPVVLPAMATRSSHLHSSYAAVNLIDRVVAIRPYSSSEVAE